MEITYESICKKLGFTPENYKPNISNYEDDSKVSPFSVLTFEELCYLSDYVMGRIKED